MEIPVVPLVTVSHSQPMEDQGPRRKNQISRFLYAGSQDNTPPIIHAIKRTWKNIMQPKNLMKQEGQVHLKIITIGVWIHQWRRLVHKC